MQATPEQTATQLSPPTRGRLRIPLWGTIRNSLQFRISLISVLLLLIVVVGTATLSLRATSSSMLSTEMERIIQWADALASSSAVELAAKNSDPGHSLSQIVQSLVESRTVAYAAYCNAAGEVLAAGQSEPGLLTWAIPPDGKRLRVDMIRTPRLVQLPFSETTCLDIITPIFGGANPQEPNHPRAIVGYLRLASSITASKARMAQISDSLLRITVGILLLAVPCSLLMTRYIVSPLNEVARAASALARGSMDARAPVRSQNEIGQLAKAFNIMANRLTQSHMELLQLAAELEARVEERTRELKELASKDPLTGLYNRRHFGEVMRRQFAAAERYSSDLTCMMFDLDHFKEINDRFGHATGDSVLIMLAQSIKTQLRVSDIAARFGGDEFILLLAQTAAPAARTLAERIMNEFAGRVAHKFGEIPTGLSVGLASLRMTEAPSSEALIKEADLALYAAKARGRNCMVEAGPSMPGAAQATLVAETPE